MCLNSERERLKDVLCVGHGSMHGITVETANTKLSSHSYQSQLWYLMITRWKVSIANETSQVWSISKQVIIMWRKLVLTPEHYSSPTHLGEHPQTLGQRQTSQSGKTTVTHHQQLQCSHQARRKYYLEILQVYFTEIWGTTCSLKSIISFSSLSCIFITLYQI